MISEVVMPQMGADMTEGTLLRWLKNEGDAVARGEIIAEIETDKANVEIEAFESGVLRKAIAAEGDTVSVGEVIAVIAGADDDISKYANGASSSAPAAPPKPTASPKAAPADATVAIPEASPGTQNASETPLAAAPEPAPTPVAPAPAKPPEAEPAPAEGRVRASPLAKKLAQERGIDLGSLRGTGPDGRILKRDLDGAKTGTSPVAAAAAAPAPASGPISGMSKMRQAIARRMAQSKRESPHYYLLVDIDMTDAMATREQINDSVPEADRISVNDLIVRACALALQRHPAFNVTLTAEQITAHDEQHVCIAIALEDGLIAPAIVGAGGMSLLQIAAAAKDLVTRAKGGVLRPDEITAGTFTVTNLGAYGIETLVGIIQPPQTAILGVGTVMPQPAVRDGAVVVRQLMKVALSADHRVTDGAQGAVFLGEIKRLLERPAALLL